MIFIASSHSREDISFFYSNRNEAREISFRDEYNVQTREKNNIAEGQQSNIVLHSAEMKEG